MRSWKSASLIAFGLLLGLAILAGIGIGGVLLEGFLVDLWWFEAIGYEGYFWQRLLYRYLVFIVAVAFFFALFFANFWIGGKYLGTRQPADNTTPETNEAVAADDRPSRSSYRRFQKRSLALYLPLTLLLAVIIAIPLFFYWEQALLWLFAPEADINDPVFGNDVSFYLFSLPVYMLLYGELMVALVVILIGLGMMYWAEHRMMPRRRGKLRRGARLHLCVIIALLFLMGVLYFLGEAFMLLYTDEQQPLFYGPGYEQMVVTLPLIGAAALLLLLTGALLLLLLNTGRGAWAMAATTVLFLAVLGVRHTPFVTDAVKRYVVTPNELTREAPYIANNIEATLAAFRLQEVETREYPIREKAWEEITPEIRLSLQNVPIWDDEDLLPVYRELQEIRPYYAFDSVDIGRYRVEDVYQQVFLAARQIDLDELSGPRRTWVNRWLKYTHGYGAVMTPASQPADAPIEWFIQGIPPNTVAGLSLNEPAIYYGTGGYSPVIAPNASHELDYASQDEMNLTDYRGDGGVPIGSLFRKLVFSLYFGERNILYTTQTTADSRLLFRRDIRERIRTLTPELILDPDPYLVVAEGRLYWIQDAYTASKWYPYAQRYAGHVEAFDRPFNYLRDSVKVVVDAYNGRVDYYLADPKDPIAVGHARIYPGLFKPMDAMPEALKAHLRYPRTLFDVQMDIYARYHQTNPQTFYNQEDAWERPHDQWRDEAKRMTAYYLTLNLIDPDRFEYSLFAPMSPLGQPNLRALAVAGSDGDNYGRIVVYNFPKGDLVYGPGQVNAFIKQDPRITQELTLWNQQGSQADRGRMVVVPVEGVVTYIQGVFLKSTEQSPMPQLARIIVSQGRLVVMASSLEEGFQALHKLIKQTQQDEPVQNLPPPDQPPAVTEAPTNAIQ